MHFSSSILLSISFLSASTSAFYPVKLPGDDNPFHSSSSRGRKRFYPIVPPEEVLASENKVTPTLDLKRFPGKFRRDNDYDAVLASTPTMENTMGINNDGKDYSYFSEVKFGSEGQKMWMLLDTGASNTWVMSTNCTTKACKVHNTFGVEDSSTLEVSEKEWDVKYGTGKVQGVFVNDTVSFAGFDLELEFGSVLDASDDFVRYPMDGLLGLGLDEARGKVPTIMQVMADQELLDKNIIGIKLQRSSDGATDGQITFGAIDKDKVSGDFSYMDVVTDAKQWEIAMDDALVDGESVGISGINAIIDTGTSFILIPEDDATLLHSMIPDSDMQGEFYTVPCSATAEVEFVFSDTKFSISPKDYVGRKGSTDGYCISNILGQTVGDDNQWLVGDVFLKNVYTVFDFDESKVGFANLNEEVSSTSSKPTATATGTATGTSTVSPVIPQDSDAESTTAAAEATESSSADGEDNAATNLLAPTWLSIVLISTTYCLSFFL